MKLFQSMLLTCALAALAQASRGPVLRKSYAQAATAESQAILDYLKRNAFPQIAATVLSLDDYTLEADGGAIFVWITAKNDWLQYEFPCAAVIHLNDPYLGKRRSFKLEDRFNFDPENDLACADEIRYC